MAAAMTEHFTLAEIESHRLCEKHNFPVALNKIPTVKTPTGFISTLAEWTSACQILEIARDRLSESITVSCGFRCPALNKLAGGEFNSQHQGFRNTKDNLSILTVQSVAFDLQTKDEAGLDRLYELLSHLPHDQLIMEDRAKGKDWIHWSWNPYHTNRSQKLHLNV